MRKTESAICIPHSKFFLLFFFFPFALNFSQTFSGTVQDALTSEFISNAEVVLMKEDYNRSDTVYTDAFGYWEFTYNPTSVQSTNHSIKQSLGNFTLQQNYPNPFNPSTNINFSIYQPDNITVSVHDITGSEIDRVSYYLTPGNYSIDWNGGGAAGVYFYTIQNSKSSETKKMIQLDGGAVVGFGSLHSTNLIEQSLVKQYPITPAKSNKGGSKRDEVRLDHYLVTIITSAFSYVSDTLYASISDGPEFRTYLTTIHHASILVDLHNDILEKMIFDPNYHLSDYHSYNHTDIPRLKTGGVDVQFFAVWVDPNYFSTDNYYNAAVQMMDILEGEAFSNSENLTIARNYNEVMNSVNNKIAGVFGVEGGHAIENDLDKLKDLYNRGMRYMTITWNNSTDWAVSAADSRSVTVGLSDFGKEVIRTMDSLGIIIDVAHTGIKTINDILETTTNPIVDTHAGVRTLRNSTRNLYDDQIQDIANSGGVIGIVFYPPFLGSNSNSVDIQTVIDHINYIVNLVGIDYVALGSDFDGIGTNTVNGLEDVSRFPSLTIKLLENGYTRNEIDKILGQNFLRVFKQVCK